MTAIGKFFSSSLGRSKSPNTPMLSVIHISPKLATAIGKIEALQTTGKNAIEHVILGHAKVPSDELPVHTSAIRAPLELDLLAFAFDFGLTVSAGKWVWLWDDSASFSTSDISDVLAALANDEANHLIWLQPPGDPTRGKSITIDDLYNGLSPAPDSIIWRADLFQRFGCFDPHLAVRDTFTFEMLLRIIRHIRLSYLSTRDGTPAIRQPDVLRDVVLYSDSRTTVPTMNSFASYAIDDLRDVERKHGQATAWRIYLEKILPYYYHHRHILPRSIFISPQSCARSGVHALFTKMQYETSNELTFWNYQREFQGKRYFHFSYLQTQMVSAPTPVQLDVSSIGRADVLVSTRTADDLNAELITQANATGLATAYWLDDDLLSFNEYGDAFASFTHGNSHYEAMKRIISDADVVVGFSDQIERSVSKLNRRYAHSEDSVPLEFLPAVSTKPISTVTHLGYAGSGYRTDEFALLRPAIERILCEYGDRVRFSFWGMSPDDVKIHGTNVAYKAFSAHYLEYLERLKNEGFDAMLVPLTAEPTPKKAKNPNKFMEAAIANAVGLYSDVPSYQIVKNGITGIKVAETTAAWYVAIKSVIEMPEEQRATIRANALEYVRIFFSTPALATTTETGILAAQLHQKTRAQRLADGRPMIAFFFPSVAGTGGGEIQLWRRLHLAQQLGLRTLVVISGLWVNDQDQQRVRTFLDEHGIEHEFVNYNAFFTTPWGLDLTPTLPELDALREFFARRGKDIALVHSLALLPAVGMACSELSIPHLASIYGIEDNYEFPDGRLPFKYCDLLQSDSIHYARKWGGMLKSEWICARENVPAELYELGFERLYVNPENTPERFRLAMVGTFMERKSQLQVIQALAWLAPQVRERIELHLYGTVDAYTEYGKACRAALVDALRAGAQVEFHGHVSDLAKVYSQSDVVLSVSTLESFPSAIKEATATGCFVIASQAGGIPEMMVDGVNSLLIDTVTPQTIADAIARFIALDDVTRLKIRRNAYLLACDEFHPRRTLHDLALGYNLCLELAGTSKTKPEQISTLPKFVAPEPKGYSALDSARKYPLAISRAHWHGLDVMIRTEGIPANGRLNLRVWSSQKRLLRKACVELAQTPDRTWVELRFTPLANSREREFTLEFSLENVAQTGIGLYESISIDNANAAHERPLDALFCQIRYAS